MENKNILVEPERHQEASDRNCVHVRRAQEIIFNLCKFVLFEILTVFNLKCLM